MPINNATRPFVFSFGKQSLQCGTVPLETVAKKYGTPLYVYSADHIRQRASLFAEAFADQRHLICYAVKANSALAILRLLDAMGSGFDIVSGGELERVLHVNREAAARTVFSGVGKTAPEMDLALKAGILLFNVESEAELDLLAERARKLKTVARIALRVNPDVFAETHPYISTGLREHKFGVDIKIAPRLYRAAASSKYLEPSGISVHIGSQIRSAEPFGAAVARVAAMATKLRAEGIAITTIDAGGGLGIDYEIEPSKAKANANPRDAVTNYAVAIKRGLRPLASEIQLLIEPGRFIVAPAGALVARVLYVKQNGAKTFVITDAGMNDLIRPALYQAHHEIVPVSPRPGRKRVVDVVGPVCESGDFFAHDRELPPLKAGDLIAILDAGAYGMSLSSNYNSRPRPAEVLVEGTKAKSIRRRETTNDQLLPETDV
ncbi:MAG TPA: diaminopimelate decarboxylase [Acidisarcina sp.]